MNPQNRKYHVILVHFGIPDATRETVHALAQCTAPPDSIIIIDHAREPFREGKPYPALVVRPGRNTGYAGGINSGLGVLLSRGVAGRDVVVVMNNDVTVSPTAFQELRRWWAAHQEAAFVGALTEEPRGTVSGVSHVNLLTGRAQPYGPPPRYALPYLHGAFIAAPYEVFMRTRGLPEGYFLYWEDAALSARARSLRIPLRVAPCVRVVHRAALASPLPAAQQYYLVRNGAHFLERETPVPWRQWWWLINRLRLVWHALNPGSDPLVRRALRDAVRHVTGPLAA